MLSSQIFFFLTHIVIGAIEFFLGMRVLLKFLGANAGSPFVDWIYNTSEPLLVPFQGIFPSKVFEGIFILELSTLVALVVYAFVGYLLSEILRLSQSMSSSQSTSSHQVQK